ncbi:MAG: response regulator, partial [Desulfobacterales bacterium]|nr:response regulator [Desulfobacterales bacterium]
KTTLNKINLKNIFHSVNGEEALKFLQMNRIDLIISDWNMPVMDGITFLKNLKSNAKTKNIKFMMVTSEGVKHNILEALKYKIDDYIVKPFTPETLVYKVTRVLNKVKKDREEEKIDEDIFDNKSIEDVDQFLDNL